MIKKCLQCNSEEYKIIYNFESIPVKKRIGKKKDIVKCKNCKLIYCFPRNQNESMLDIYRKNYWDEFQIKVGEKSIKYRRKEFEKISEERIEFISKIKSYGKLLDVGCSEGFLVYEAKKKGYNSFGIDLNQKNIEYGKKKYNIKLKNSMIKNYREKNFDVITSFNVLEHVSFPDLMIKEMEKRIKKNGLLVIGTHDILCRNHKIEKQKWKHIIPNEHLYYFSKKTLKNLVEKENFRLIKYMKPINNSIVGYFKCIK